jgi:hypothetical protein
MTDEKRDSGPARAWMDANRLNWDDRVAVHLRNRTGFYPIDRISAGDNTFGEVDNRLVAVQSWRAPIAAPLVHDDVMTYTGDATPLAHTRSYEWCHPLSDVIGSLLNAGLHLDFLHEHEGLPWRDFSMMVKAENWG